MKRPNQDDNITFYVCSRQEDMLEELSKKSFTDEFEIKMNARQWVLDTLNSMELKNDYKMDKKNGINMDFFESVKHTSFKKKTSSFLLL